MEALYDAGSELVQSLSREEAITSVLIGADTDISVLSVPDPVLPVNVILEKKSQFGRRSNHENN